MADVLVPEQEIGTFTTNVPRVSDEYTKPFSSERRVAEFGVRATDQGFEASISVFRKTEEGGFELEYEKSIPSTDLGKSIVDLGRLRREAGVPDSDIGRIQTPDDRANKSRDPFKGPKAEPPAPKPEDRSLAEAPANLPNLQRVGIPGPERDPADRAEGLGPAAPPESIEVPSDVADLVDYHISQWERATTEWREPLELGLRLMFPLPGMNPADWRDMLRGGADILRIGQGAAEGTARGVIQDVNRALSAFPQTRGIGRVVDVLSTATGAAAGVVEAANAQSTGQGGAAAVLAIAGVLGIMPQGRGGSNRFPRSVRSFLEDFKGSVIKRRKVSDYYAGDSPYFREMYKSYDNIHTVIFTDPKVRIRAVELSSGEMMYRFEITDQSFTDDPMFVPSDMRVSKMFAPGDKVPEAIEEWFPYMPHVNDGKNGPSLLREEFFSAWRTGVKWLTRD